MRVVGFDTALRATGYGIVAWQTGKLQHLGHGVIRNPAGRPHSACLGHLFTEVQALLTEAQPGAVVIEGVFLRHNPHTALTLGQARGAVIVAATLAGCPVYEQAPRRVKQALVGSGAAQKEQVAQMVMRLLALTKRPPLDATDALALAISHLHGLRRPAALQPQPL